MMVPSSTDEHPTLPVGVSDDTATIQRLQRALDRSLRERAELSDRLADSMTRNIELATLHRHWFVDDGDGYCAACGNLERNVARHADRQATA